MQSGTLFGAVKANAFNIYRGTWTYLGSEITHTFQDGSTSPIMVTDDIEFHTSVTDADAALLKVAKKSDEDEKPTTDEHAGKVWSYIADAPDGRSTKAVQDFRGLSYAATIRPLSKMAEAEQLEKSQIVSTSKRFV